MISDTSSDSERYMDLARQTAAQCWCDPQTSHLVMDPPLAEAFARRLAAWMETADQGYRSTAFYRNLLDVGEEVFVCDDGTVADTPLRLKIPDLVRRFGASPSSR